MNFGGGVGCLRKGKMFCCPHNTEWPALRSEEMTVTCLLESKLKRTNNSLAATVRAACGSSFGLRAQQEAVSHQQLSSLVAGAKGDFRIRKFKVTSCTSHGPTCLCPKVFIKVVPASANRLGWNVWFFL